MACGRRSGYQLIVSDINFEGKVNPRKYCKVIIDILKYAIFSRGQIPSQYDMWSSDLLVPKHSDVADKIPPITKRKSKETAEKLERWFQDISNLFRSYKDIEEFLLVIGATYASPKVTYKIKLPLNLWLKNSDSTVEVYNYHILKELLKTEYEIPSKDIPATNMNLFVKMRIGAGNDSFVPKPDFQPFSRGICVNINFNEKQRPLEKTQFPVFKDSVINSQENNSEVAATVSELKLKETISSESIWFQSAITIKGIKN